MHSKTMFGHNDTMQKQLKVTINGKQYSIATDENDHDIVDAAELVDSLLKSKAAKQAPGTEDKAALIVALQIAKDLAKNKRHLQLCEQKIEELLALCSEA
jgi:cell division protein ZapA (FtsZ GTPase activity inhibitor)